MREFPEVELIPVYLENLHRSHAERCPSARSDYVLRKIRCTSAALYRRL